MAGIQVAESVKGRKSKKVLSHLEIHPKLGGGHIVKHVYTDFEHKPMEHHFNENGKSQGGQHIMAHLIQHGGLPSDRAQDEPLTPEEQ